MSDLEVSLEDNPDAGPRPYEIYSTQHPDDSHYDGDDSYIYESVENNEDERTGMSAAVLESYEHNSSSSSSHHSGGFTLEDDLYGEDGVAAPGTGGASSRSSLSSLPGSIVVKPRTDLETLTPAHFRGQPSYQSPRSEGTKRGMSDYKFASQVRDRDSPFRHPSSVRAMQMGDEYDDDIHVSTPSKGRRQGKVKGAHTPSISGMSMRSLVSSPPSAKRMYHSPHAKSPHAQQKQQQKEYPLVLLHCTVLPPALPLPPGINQPSQQVLKEVLPERYWRRWKLLEDKIINSGLLRDRGLLISHPQEMYDVLEERLLESLELVRPRLGHGHFLGREDSKGDGERGRSDGHEASDSDDSDQGNKCHDCGARVPRHNEWEERKWEVRVYAGNGLMKAGAWAAAWREMEKVDVEVGVWLPTDIKRELERRIVEEENLKMEEELRLAEEEKRRREIYGDPSPPQLDANEHFEEERAISDNYPDDNFDPSPPKPHPAPQASKKRPRRRLTLNEVDLQTLFVNYIRVLASDRRNVALAFLSVLVLYLAVGLAGGRAPSVSDIRPSVPGVVPAASHPVSIIEQSASSSAVVDTVLAGSHPASIVEQPTSSTPVADIPSAAHEILLSSSTVVQPAISGQQTTSQVTSEDILEPSASASSSSLTEESVKMPLSEQEPEPQEPGYEESAQEDSA